MLGGTIYLYQTEAMWDMDVTHTGFSVDENDQEEVVKALIWKGEADFFVENGQHSPDLLLTTRNPEKEEGPIIPGNDLFSWNHSAMVVEDINDNGYVDILDIKDPAWAEVLNITYDTKGISDALDTL